MIAMGKFTKRTASHLSVCAIAVAQVLIGSIEARANGAIEAARADDRSVQRIRVSDDSIRRTFERLTEGEIKEFYIRCSSAALARPLDGSEAAACSIGYDVLLKRHFDGDFHALWAWSRRHRDVTSQAGVDL